jgi:hypothetical protein
MILLITPSLRAEECATALEEAIHQPVQISPTLEQASLLLRENEYCAVVVDQLALEVDPDEGDILHAHLGSAVPVYVNFGINSKKRVLHDVQSALRRRSSDERAARLSAQQHLRNELKETVTAMLLSCELLAASPEVPEPARQKLRGVQELAGHLQLQLGAGS